MNNYIKEKAELLKEVHNLIFTGAPGTGKTYLAKQIAKQMIGVETDGELEQCGQFAFVQFHPSYDYTDFVEGLRPTKPDANGNIGFKLEKGVFKVFCIKAQNVQENTIDNFDEAYSKLISSILENENKVTIPTKQQEKELTLCVNKNNNLSRKSESAQTDYSLTKENIYFTYQGKEAKYLDNYNKAVIEKMKKDFGLKDYAKSDKKNDKPFVFIIDEINRGEISKIFGELFFSIDPSYRGKKGAVKTQYSNMHEDENEVFHIPENVYIIGTMNDIDRSVESFDFAMRRRFTWEEITAEESAENMNLPREIKDKMANLNAKISEIDGLNASYHIGGAYFLNADGEPRADSDYEAIWKFRLEPLLKEYLRGMSEVEKNLKELKNAYNAETDNGQ